MNNDTRVFFVVDSIEDDEEIFETLGQAEDYINTLSATRTEDEIGTPNKPRIYVAIVRDAYRDGGGWNYDAHSNTFEIIKVID